MTTYWSWSTVLYWIQIVGGVTFGVLQARHMVLYSTHGLSVSMFLCTSLFILCNLSLAYAAYAEHHTRALREVVIIYAVGLGTYGVLLVTMLLYAEVKWDTYDQRTLLVVSACLLYVLGYAWIRCTPLLDPLMKGVYSLICKAVPQCVLALKIYALGGAGLPLVSILIFHTLTCLRIGQVFATIRGAGWDRNRTGLLVSETGNELSWVCVTLAWLS